MGQTTYSSKNASRTVNSAEDILGQFYYAFGQGAGAVRVQRAAIAALRARYLGPIQAAPGPWDAVAGNVLGLVAQVGRLAALLATQDGRAAISEADFVRARQVVEARAHQREDASRTLFCGIYCPPVSEETNPLPQQPELSADAGETVPGLAVQADGWHADFDPASSPRTH
jgi:hypothetical protein